MAFHCKHCGETFHCEEVKPRCPSCMRITTVREVRDAPVARRIKEASNAGVRRRARDQASEMESARPSTGSPEGPASIPLAPGRAPPSGAGIGSPPWPLWVGAALMAVNLLAVYGTDFQSMGDGERLGAAATFAALGGAGLALAVRGLMAWRPWR